MSLEIERATKECSIEALYRAYYKRIVTKFYASTHDWHDAEDLAQETFLGLWKASVARKVQRPVALLFTAVRNRTTNYFRDRQTNPFRDRRTFLSLEELGEGTRWEPARLHALAGPSAEEFLFTRLQRSALLDGIAGLTSAQRQAYGLVDFRGLTEEEAAVVVGRSRSTVSTLRRRAQGALRSGLLFAQIL